MEEQTERNKRIHELRKQEKPFTEIGKKYGISASRVQQIYNDLENPSRFCNVHKKVYKIQCQFCRIAERYPGLLTNLGSILREVETLKNTKSRDALTVRKRKMVVRKLKDDYKLSYVQIGFMMNLDRTTIMYHYANQ